MKVVVAVYGVRYEFSEILGVADTPAAAKRHLKKWMKSNGRTDRLRPWRGDLMELGGDSYVELESHEVAW